MVRLSFGLHFTGVSGLKFSFYSRNVRLTKDPPLHCQNKELQPLINILLDLINLNLSRYSTAPMIYMM